MFRPRLAATASVIPAACQSLGGLTMHWQIGRQTVRQRSASTEERQNMNLSQRTAVITGGSRGLGRALGQALARAGARVVLIAQQPGPLATAVEEIRAAGGEAHGVCAD